jgi:nitrite reductase/ring-hydroxylating ferredoxin subunit
MSAYIRAALAARAYHAQGPGRAGGGQDLVRHTFSENDAHFVCPWHGYEYDIKTGECAGNRKLRLQSYEVVRRGPDVYVIAG